MRVCEDQILYNKIAHQLRLWEIVTRDQINAIKRYQSRKRRYWKRHIYDLCTFALKKIERDAINNPQAVQLCKEGIAYYETAPYETRREPETD